MDPLINPTLFTKDLALDPSRSLPVLSRLCPSDTARPQQLGPNRSIPAFSLVWPPDKINRKSPVLPGLILPKNPLLIVFGRSENGRHPLQGPFMWAHYWLCDQSSSLG
ncbi:Hypothetical protein NTJ_03619 [Nesidiocoris tenuis]|uniref:Uncharacterized protein n=1 Tax=Nesidiocoris tenuis TaxID=355587 RepID=A0ABN7AIV0_9HEMI|nr:Hypothetical protein NTJ_03619 [Nesidiocoris tenuis]